MKFNLDNPFFRLLSKLVDCIYVSFLWLVCSLPIITLGASTSALYYTVHKSIRGGREYVGRSFFKSFRENFKQATLSWLVVLIVGIVLLLDAIIMRQVMIGGSTVGAMFYVFLVGILFWVGFCCVLFPYIARFENTVKQTLINTLLLEIRHLPWSLLLILIVAVVLVLLWLIPIQILPLVIFMLPAFTFLIFEVILERIFRRYMSEEDLRRELEIEELDKLEDSLR